VIDTEGAEEEQSPAAADAEAADESVPLALFNKDAGGEQHETDGVNQQGFAGGAEVLQRELAKKGKPDHRHDDAENGEPAGAQQLFDGRNGFRRLDVSRLRRCGF
jgi:hypothetical protein